VSSAPVAAKHRHVFEVVRKRIQTGDYQPGDRIPSEARLIEEFGVSRPTVARALQELQRRGLIHRRRGAGTYVSSTDTSGKLFGLLIPGLGATEVFEPICAEMARLAQQDGHSLLWGAAHVSIGRDETHVDKGAIAWDLCQRFIRDRVGGVFFAPLELDPNQDSINRRIAAAFDEAKLPVVLLDRDYVQYPGRSNHDLVGINNRRVGHTITDHLFECGCKRLVFILRPGSTSATHARTAGFAEAFITRRVAFDVNLIHECDPADTAYIQKLLDEQEPDGIICANDVTAGHLLRTLDELGVRVPDDVMIGGIDDVKYAELLRVPLTTVRQPFAAIGDAAYYAMLERIERPNATPRHITLVFEPTAVEVVINDESFGDVNCTGKLGVEPAARNGCHSAVANHVGRRQDFDPVADGSHRLVVFKKVFRDAEKILIVAKKLGRPPAGQHETNKLVWIHIAKCDVGFERITGRFDGDIPIGIVVVLNEVVQALGRSCFDNFEVFREAVQRHHRVDDFCAVTDHE